MARDKQSADDGPATPDEAVAAPSALTTRPADVVGTAGASPAAAPDPEASRRAQAQDPVCPTCGGPLERYTGTNPHKSDTGWCAPCGLRHRLDQ